MGRKDKVTEAEAEAVETVEADQKGFDSGDPSNVDPGLDTDFDLEEEYKPEPLVPGGNYRGNVTGVAIDAAQNCVAWKVVLADNGGVMSDGKTPIDGWAGYCRNWMPNPGDENTMTKDNRQTKRQSKINMMTRFAEGMKVNMNSRKIIDEAIANQDWIGIPVIVAISVDTWEGRTRNEINRMVAATVEATDAE